MPTAIGTLVPSYSYGFCKEAALGVQAGRDIGTSSRGHADGAGRKRVTSPSTRVILTLQQSSTNVVYTNLVAQLVGWLVG